jgi:hypothetical protein
MNSNIIKLVKFWRARASLNGNAFENKYVSRIFSSEPTESDLVEFMKDFNCFDSEVEIISYWVRVPI